MQELVECFACSVAVVLDLAGGHGRAARHGVAKQRPLVLIGEFREQLPLGGREDSGADGVDDLQGEEERLQQSLESIRQCRFVEVARSQIGVVDHVIQVGDADPGTQTNVILVILRQQGVKIAQPDLGPMLELIQLIRRPGRQLRPAAGEADRALAIGQ